MGRSALDTILGMVPPPDSPYVGERGWETVFADVGTRLPDEYVDLLDHYGAGIWGGWLRFNPPGRSGTYGMPQVSADGLDAYRALRDSTPKYYPLPVWPEPGGFLPVADTIDGDYLGWLTEGADPNAWPLIFWPRHNDQGPPLTCNLTEVVHALITGDHEKLGFSVDDGEDAPHPPVPAFEPFTTATYGPHE